MSALTKKLSTEQTAFYVVCPAGVDTTHAKATLERMGCHVSDTLTPNEVFPNRHPGTLLSGARYREGLTQAQLAEKTGINRRHISEMENGKRPIGKANAKKLSDALGVDYRVLL
ncbi:DNA-binding XRE family transcriptional regulator [Desulfobaculum xiamenense]|uniref:DNA-binding XRE family transcriptional regulator n=1 Tax=Desulfobaculum xiamenense TaxID=995050 RepID=A0A846QJI2_9BACT|nr:helix-turn-helix transcriptional regulator [Desulfobaculum xiamenense]NJB67230.1 DNA-binding XRE family transcriptional regulator [Desulfobaculum xiamenense]